MSLAVSKFSINVDGEVFGFKINGYGVIVVLSDRTAEWNSVIGHEKMSMIICFV